MSEAAEDTKIVEAEYRTILQWASQNGVQFKNINDLGRVNRKRLDLNMPQFRMFGLTQDVSEQFVTRTPAQIAEPHVETVTKVESKMEMSQSKQSRETIDQSGEKVLPKKMDRSLQGLSEAMFDALDELRDGTGSVEKVKAICDVSGRISTMIHAQIKVIQMSEKMANREDAEKIKKLVG